MNVINVEQSEFNVPKKTLKLRNKSNIIDLDIGKEVYIRINGRVLNIPFYIDTVSHEQSADYIGIPTDIPRRFSNPSYEIDVRFKSQY